MKKIFAFLLALLGLSTACGQQNYEDTDVQGFAALVADTSVVVLDVRTASEFAEGHIARAVNIDYRQSDFEKKAKAALPLDKKIAVYCRRSDCRRSPQITVSCSGRTCYNISGVDQDRCAERDARGSSKGQLPARLT